MSKARDLANLLADGSIGSAEIANGAVIADKLASGASLANLADGSIPAAKFASGATARSLRSQSFPITGDISANTWYTLTNTGLFDANAVGFLWGYSNTEGFGGDQYDVVLTAGAFPLRNRATNDSTIFNFPSPMYAGHAANGQRFNFRLRYQGGNPAPVLIEWQSTYAMSGLIAGRLTFYVHELVGL